MHKEKIGILGGTGLYHFEGLGPLQEIWLPTPYGDPSGPYLRGEFQGKECFFLARHGQNHSILPHEINFRANIWGFKKLGVETILSVSAVGSMQEEIQPGDLVFPHQFFDRTRMRPSTFFGDGLVAHISFADPICVELSDLLYAVASDLGYTAHRGGTYLCIEGPQFSTRAESHVYRSWGVDIIGMTNLQEAKLAREAEICYATIALVTDYDCWHQTEEDVSVEGVMETLKSNVEKAQAVIRTAIERISNDQKKCNCCQALDTAILTPPDTIPKAARQKLEPILARYLSKHSEKQGKG